MSKRKTYLTTSHWGAFQVMTDDGQMVGTAPFAADPAPPETIQYVPAAVHHRLRIDRPYVRKGWLEKTEGARRGGDEFVALPWDEALDIAAKELLRVKDSFGTGAIYGGSYGWASAGRFHHAQSQVHRFLNCFGGYVSSYASYSTAAAQAHICDVWRSEPEEFPSQHGRSDRAQDGRPFQTVCRARKAAYLGQPAKR